MLHHQLTRQRPGFWARQVRGLLLLVVFAVGLRHTSQVYGVFAIVLGLLFWLYLGARLTLYAAEVNVVAARRLWPCSLLQPPAGQHQPTRRSG